MSPRRQNGFSLIELIVAAGLCVAIGAMLLDFAATSQRVARLEPDAADLNQRLRVAAGALERDLRSAGGTSPHAPVGTLSAFLPPIQPARTGVSAPDGELTAFPDRITILTLADRTWAARVSSDVAHATADIAIDPDAPGCPAAGLCGFVAGTRAAIIDTDRLGAGYDLFTVTDIAAGLARAAPNPPLSKLYRAGTSVVMPVEQSVYYLDRAERRLMRYDGFRSALPLVDHVVDLQFAYFADSHPASVAAPIDGAGNCAYGAGDPPPPLLAPLGAGTIVELPLARLTDGPYCGVAPNRFDADLLRIRRVRVTLRLQAANARVRDLEVTFHVAPRNMVAGR
jgi:type II secretory pathway pseudopilin PulG